MANIRSIVLSLVVSFTCNVSSRAHAETPADTLARPQTIVELRQYTVHPGKRDVLIGLFDRNFVESQEAQGMRIIGQFRDLNHPDRFVWLRSFADMAIRASALQAFYFGPVWQAHRDSANPTMVDSDNVLLLRPLRPDTGFANPTSTRPSPDAMGVGKGLIVGSIVYLRASVTGGFEDFFEKEMEPILVSSGGKIVAKLVSDHSPNDFPRLPVRDGENVFVWFMSFPNASSFENQSRQLAKSAQWRVVRGRLSLWTFQPIEILSLQPTVRSQLQWH